MKKYIAIVTLTLLSGTICAFEPGSGKKKVASPGAIGSGKLKNPNKKDDILPPCAAPHINAIAIKKDGILPPCAAPSIKDKGRTLCGSIINKTNRLLMVITTDIYDRPSVHQCHPEGKLTFTFPQERIDALVGDGISMCRGKFQTNTTYWIRRSQSGKNMIKSYSHNGEIHKRVLNELWHKDESTTPAKTDIQDGIEQTLKRTSISKCFTEQLLYRAQFDNPLFYIPVDASFATIKQD